MNKKNLPAKWILASYLLWWLFWLFAQTIVLHKFGFSWRLSIIDAILFTLLLVLAGYATQNTYRFYQPGPRNRMYRFGWSVALALLCVVVFNAAISQLYVEDADYLIFLQKSLPIRFMFALLMIALITVISWMLVYVKEQNENEGREGAAEKLLREAELARLRQQLQPHFLFNSLNSISALVVAKPEEARKMIQQLSDFLRGTLKKDEQQLVPLSEELQHLQLYLDIEKVRFGHRLNTIVEYDEASPVMKLPSLLLQPIVENAIKFGLYDTTEEITIRINAKGESGHLIIRVENPFDKETAKPKQGIGFGLNFIQRRLYLLYARNDLLSTSQQGELFITALKIPQTAI